MTHGLRDIAARFLRPNESEGPETPYRPRMHGTETLPSAGLPLLSVILATGADSRRDANAIRSLLRMRRDSGIAPGAVEIIVADDASPPAALLRMRLAMGGAKHIRFTRHVSRSGTAAAWNTGSLHARGQRLLFLTVRAMPASKRIRELLLAPADVTNPLCLTADSFRRLGGFHEAAQDENAPQWSDAGSALRSRPIIFVAHKTYHAETMCRVAKRMENTAATGTFPQTLFLDMAPVIGDLGVRQTVNSYSFTTMPLNEFLLHGEPPAMLVTMNDWDRHTRPLVQWCREAGVPTVGIVEGINDFLDADTGLARRAYRTVEHLLLAGEHDRQFFADRPDNIAVGGLPRLEPLLREPVRRPEKPLAVVNVNFTYGVLEHKRRMWLESVTEGCRRAGIPFVITRHPHDIGPLKGWPVSEENMYDLIRQGSVFISRFSSGIPEALALGTPVVYHNPHGEKVSKFENPMGAYSTSRDADSLAEALAHELGRQDVRRDAEPFLAHHANITDTAQAGESSTIRTIAAHLRNLLDNNKRST